VCRPPTRVNAEQAPKKTMCRPTRLPYRGRLKWLGELSEEYSQLLHRGIGGGMYTRNMYTRKECGRVQPLQEPDTGNIDAPFFSTLGRFLDPFNVLESAVGNRASLE
jgi:hypothetical protein